MKKIYPVRNKPPQAAVAVPKVGRISNGIYLDYAATTPVESRVFKEMEPYFSEKYGNPGSLHLFGQEAIAAVDRSRETIAEMIGAPLAAGFREVIFTGSATEANNLALRGVVKQLKIQNSKFKIPRIIVSAIEHESVLRTAEDLEKDGVEVIYIPVSRKGFVDLKKLKSALDEKTILVSVMYANNEIGTVQPISEISKVIKKFRSTKIHNLTPNTYPLFHTDAVQAFQYLDCDVSKLGVDLMTLSAHKIYGPKGVGALYVRNLQLNTYNSSSLRSSEPNGLKPIITGGGHEFGLRSGTENVPSIIGFARAVEFAAEMREKERKRISKLRDYFWKELKKIYPAALRNGGEPNLPNILNIYFPNHLSEDLLIKLDMAGVAVSSGSACRARSTKPSHVLEALRLPTKRIKSSIRFSLGRFTKRQEIKEALERIKKVF